MEHALGGEGMSTHTTTEESKYGGSVNLYNFLEKSFGNMYQEIHDVYIF